MKLKAKDLWIGTFHSIALRILSKHHQEAGLNAYFHILDMQDQLNVIKRIIKQANLDEDRYQARELQKFINSQKEQGLRSQDLVANGLRQEYWINLYASYEETCNKDNLVDFTELLLRSFRESCFSCLDEVLLGYRQGPFNLRRTLLARRSLLMVQLKYFMNKGEWGNTLLSITIIILKVVLDGIAALPGAEQLFFMRMAEPVPASVIEDLRSCLEE
jgi:hypothetical protein